MNKRLILTGEDEFLKDLNGTEFYLGPWCFIHNSKFKFWSGPQARCIPAPIQNEADLQQASHYVLTLIDRIMPSLVLYLNRATRQQRSEKYWRTVSFHWLTEFLCVYFDRYQRIKNAAAHFEGEKIEIDLPDFSKEGLERPFDYSDYYRRYLNDHRYNLHLFSDFVEYFSSFDITLRPLAGQPKLQNAAQVSTSSGFKIRSLIGNFLGLFTSFPELHLGNIKGVEGKKLRQLSFVKIGFPKFKASLKSAVVHQPVLEKLEFESTNDFELSVARNLTKYIPLELFHEFPKQKRNVKTFIGNDIYDFPQKFLLAEILEQGGVWLGCQHGGTYAVVHNLPQVKVEYFFADRFITWGWRDSKNLENFIPMPSPYLSQLKASFAAAQKTEVLYVATAVPMYTYRFDSCALPERQMIYFRDFQEFAQKLDSAKLADLKLKSYHYDFHLDLKEFYQQFIKPAQWIDEHERLVNLLSRAKLVINDNLHTSFLESFALNVPTVLFVNPQVFPVTDDFKPWIDRLKDLKIYHDTADSLSKHLDEIWQNPDAWWGRPEIQAFLKDFCNHYARNHPEWQRVWADWLKTLA